MFGDLDPGHLYLARIDGTKVEKIAGGRGEYEIYYSPDISPDGSRIVYATARYPGERARSLEIETADLDGSNRRDREDKRIIGKSPVWSPDGSRIAFIYPSSGHYVMAADGSEERTVFGPEYYGQLFELGAKYYWDLPVFILTPGLVTGRDQAGVGGPFFACL